MEVVVNTTTTFMVTGLMALAMDRQWPVVDAAKVTRESTARWPYVDQVVPTVAAVSIRMFVHVLMDIREPDVKQVYLQYLLAEICFFEIGTYVKLVVIKMGDYLHTSKQIYISTTHT